MQIKHTIMDLAQQVGNLLEAETDTTDMECLIKKSRTVTIQLHDKRFDCTLEHDISFRNLKSDGSAVNEADIYLLPEEVALFTEALQNHPIALPTEFGQRIDSNPNIVCLRLMAEEPPESFAARLAAALHQID
ncbi:DUF1259 domain-containing protein [Planococcus maritimus]|uniref:DUF1259 domain-containing protein n=1 Tax=Planococcus maritimus TaxID=192421 RepID=A0A7D7MGD6_PLAMR|nr:DUF1259 domain-containing protein [Planococcus maritimus]KYG60090.1 hypothetical protein AY633_07625 [Planococcus maritimus]QMT17367.1 DUF1259 domain-containing protein [Planococcus maritimus]